MICQGFFALKHQFLRGEDDGKVAVVVGFYALDIGIGYPKPTQDLAIGIGLFLAPLQDGREM